MTGDRPQVRYERIGPVALVVLDRPDHLNAQSRRLREEMDEAFATAMADDDVRVVVLKGEGRSFSAGHDLGSPEELADRQRRGVAPTVRNRVQWSWDINVDNSLRWRDLPKPTIAQVHGYCIFGGWIIASAMDLIVASDDALFLPGLFQCFGVPWELGPRQAKEALFTQRFMTAAEAHEHGFVSRVVALDRLDDEVLALANEIAEADPLYLLMAKRAVNQAQDAMGFRAAVGAAHASYMVVEMGGALTPADGGPRRLPPVDAAVRKLQEARRAQ